MLEHRQYILTATDTAASVAAGLAAVYAATPLVRRAGRRS